MSRHPTDEIEQAIARIVTVDGRTNADVVARELGVFVALDGRQRGFVADRLSVLDALMRIERRSTADVVAAAGTLGLRQSAMYRLMKNVAERGPVSGLLRLRPADAGPSATKAGFGEPLDGWIADVLRRRPTASVADVDTALRSKAALLPRDRPAIPNQSALRRRVHHLRATGVSGAILDGPIGDRLVVDQCSIGAMVSIDREDSEKPAMREAQAVFVIDEDTSLVLGCGVFVEKDAATGLGAALADLARSLQDLVARDGLEIAAAPSQVRWIVPPVLVDGARMVVVEAASFRPTLHLNVVAGPGTRIGQEVYGHIGESLPPFTLTTRLVLSGPHGTDVLDPDRRPGDVVTGSDLEGTSAALRYELERRNESILNASAAANGATRRAPPRIVDEQPPRPAAADGLAGCLRRMFAPIVQHPLRKALPPLPGQGGCVQPES